MMPNQKTIIPLVQEKARAYLNQASKNERKMREEMQKGLMETKANDLEFN